MTAVQVSPQIVANLDQSVSLVLQLCDLLVSILNFGLELFDFPVALQIGGASVSDLFRDRILHLLDNGLHIDFHLLNHFLQCFVFFLDELHLQLRVLCSGALEHLGQWSRRLLVGQRLEAVRCVTLLHYIVVPLDEVVLEAVQAVVQGRTPCLLVVALHKLLQVLRRRWLVLPCTA